MGGVGAASVTAFGLLGIKAAEQATNEWESVGRLASICRYIDDAVEQKTILGHVIELNTAAIKFITVVELKIKDIVVKIKLRLKLHKGKALL